MAPDRSHESAREDYLEILEDSRLRCKICSQSMHRDVTFKKDSKKKHLKTVIHKAAMGEASQGNPVANATNEIEALTREPAVLTFADRFLLEDSDSELEEALQQLEDNVFHDIMAHDEVFYGEDGAEIIFSAGKNTLEESDSEMQLWQEMDGLKYYDPSYLAQMLGDEPEDVTIPKSIAALEALGLHDPDSESEDASSDTNEDVEMDMDEDTAWLPHGSKTVFFLDLLDNLPRLRLSDDQMKAIIWAMRECGTPSVPSFYALRKKQASLVADISNLQPRHHISALGNHFYMNHPIDLISLDWANPFVREFIQIYPEITENVSESWQADKFTKEINDQLTPMWADWKLASYKHFYVNEVAQLQDGRFVLPLRWIIFNKEEHVEVLFLSQNELAEFIVNDPEMKRIPCTDLKYNYLDLKTQFPDLKFRNLRSDLEVMMPHPVRKIANGRPAFSIRIMPWADDVSGNRSKQYNAHMNVYVANVNLPHRKLSQEYFVRFCSTSPHASSSEQLEALAEDLKSDKWNEAYDCKLNEEIIFQMHGHLLPADNPQQAEHTSTAGANANLWCRGDDSGGSDEHRESNEGYHALFEPGIPRTPEQTIKTIKDQIWAAGRGVQDAVDKIQTKTGVKDRTASFWIQQMIDKARQIQQDRLTTEATRDPRLNDKKVKGPDRESIKESIKAAIQQEVFDWVLTQPRERYDRLPQNSPLRKSLRPGDHFNVLLSIKGLDPHKDTPCEILHTVELGEDKYIWHETNKVWDKKKDAQFAIRLQSSSTDGLSLSPLRAHYMVQYKNSLIGKHFKALQQLAVFHLHGGLCSKELFDLWKANGELGALIWYPEIKDIDKYLADLQILLDNVLDLWAVFDPSRIQYKYKLHVLSHLKADILRFGPAVLFATEIFECWNAVFRLCSVLSNHQAPSFDIATTLAGLERFKHQVSGGWWKNGNGDYIQAGAKVRNFLSNNKELRRRLGLADRSSSPPGFVKLVSKAKRASLLLHDAHPNFNAETQQLALISSDDLESRKWADCRYVVSRSGDVCKPDSWVFFEKMPLDGTSSPKTLAGRIFKILSPEDAREDSGLALTIVEHFDVSSTNDNHFGMPILSRSGGVEIVKAKHLLFIFNAQHDCFSGACGTTEDIVIQGRDRTTRTQKTISHSNDSRFVLNMHALHNANLIRETLPTSLYKPRPLFSDRRAKHDEIAAGLRVTGPKKRVAQKEKSKATRAKNKAKEANR